VGKQNIEPYNIEGDKHVLVLCTHELPVIWVEQVESGSNNYIK